jgi:hypothetical protein
VEPEPRRHPRLHHADRAHSPPLKLAVFAS